MNSPITNKPMTLHKEEDKISYRKVVCKYIRCWWECEDTGEQFTTTEMDENHLFQIHRYWLSTRNPRKKENKTEKILRDLKNKYKAWLSEEKVTKLAKTPNYIKEVTLQAKIEALSELESKLNKI